MTAKTRAVPSPPERSGRPSGRAGLHRDSPAGGAKVPGPCQCLRQVTQPPFITGPLAQKYRLKERTCTEQKSLYLSIDFDKFVKNF